MSKQLKNQQLPKEQSPRLSNDDLLPCKQTWGAYNIFAFWMADIHSVGGYIFAGTLFALGLTSWQIFLVLLFSISIVMVLANLIGKPSQLSGAPYPVIARMSFGVYGANIPAMLRGVIAVVWYGIQTYLASIALMIILLRFFPSLHPLTEKSFVGLSYLGWISFLLMWALQTGLFLMRMEAIKVFLDWSGPAIYLAMFVLMGWVIYHAGWSNIQFNLSTEKLDLWETITAMLIGTSLIVNYFAGPTLNFGDFSRFTHSMKAVKWGNFWGLPINFILFSFICVITISGTPAIFGRLIMDPLEIVAELEDISLVLLISIVFITATIGINIVANFVSAANDISNFYPGKISWLKGGLIAAVISILICPWKLYHSPEIIHHTIDLLAGTIGPIYGIMLVDYYAIRKKIINLGDLYSETENATYWYQKGFNHKAIKALIPASLISITCVVFANFDFADNHPLLKMIGEFANFSLFLSALIAGSIYYTLNTKILPK